MQLRIDGQYFLPGSSRQAAGSLLCRKIDQDWQLELQDEPGGTIVTALLNEIQLGQPLGSLPRRLTLPDGTLFETDDHAALHSLTGTRGGNRLHKLEQFRPRLLGIVAATAVAIWLVWQYGLDLIADAAISVTPAAVIEQIDKGVVEYIDLADGYATRLDDAQQAKVQVIFDRLVQTQQATSAGTEFKLLFRYMPYTGPNAMALPGGTIIVTDDLIEGFPDPDTIAGVLGHEIGHVTEQHGLKRLYRSLTIYILLAFISVDTGPLFDELLAGGNFLLNMKYSRTHETAADSFSVQLVHAAGYDPLGLVKFFDQMRKEESGDPSMSWLSSHPSGLDRIQAINNLADNLPK